MHHPVSWALRLAVLLLLVPAAVAQENGTAPDGTGNATVEGPTEPVLEPWVAPYTGPLEGALGESGALFVANLLAWVLIGAAVVLVVAPLLKWAFARTPTHLDAHIFGIVSGPGFIMVFTFGIVDSLRVWALPAWLRTTLDHIWEVILIVGLTYIIYRVWHEVVLEVGKKVSRRTESQLDDKLFPVFDKIGGIIILFGGLWFVLAGLGINMTFFAAGGAIGGLVIAFAAQDTLGNLFAGIFILLDQPFREGDRIEIKEENTWGDVVEIGLRTTRIRTRDNRMVVVPNTLIGTNAVINHSFPDSTYRFESDIGIAYGSDIELAREGMIESVKRVGGILHERGIDCLFMGFGDSALTFRVRWWMSSYEDVRQVQDAVHTEIDKELRARGVEIPFPQRDVWFKNPLAAADGVAKPEA